MPRNKAEFAAQLGAAEAEETLHAIRHGAVDAFVVEAPEGHRVYTLEVADLPYSTLAERMQQGAAMLNAGGDIIYCNPSLAALLGASRDSVIGLPLRNFIEPADHALCSKLLARCEHDSGEAEMRLHRSDGTQTPARFSFRLLSQDHRTVGVLVTDLTAEKHLAVLASRLQQLQDDERRRIARELHDSVGQSLVALSLNIAKVQAETDKLSPEASAAIIDNAHLVEAVSAEIRTLSHLLHPPLLDEVGLPSALRWYIDGFAKRSNLDATLHIPSDLMRLPQDVEIAIFRAVQECLTNIHRHSGSTTCAVSITREGDQLRVEIKDSGRGIARDRQATLVSSGGVGLRGMQERIRQLGGTLDIQSSSAGTTVTATLPIIEEKSASACQDVA